MEEKRILFIAYTMNIGGVEKALLGVLKRYVNLGWSVELGLVKSCGVFLQEVPTGVTVFEIASLNKAAAFLHATPLDNLRNAFKCLNFIQCFSLLYDYICYKISGSLFHQYKKYFKRLPELGKEYDVAVAFAGPFALIDYYVATKVKSKEKWGWIHYDISKFSHDKMIIKKAYSKFNLINIVSEQGKVIFDSFFSEFSSITKFTPNIIDSEFILKASKDKIVTKECDTSNRKIKILTVGRISPEKGQFIALEALRRIISRSNQLQNLQWWFVGDGSDMQRCKAFVQENQMQDFVVFCGVQPNPYPYMASCDIYVQPSVHEGFCITLGEAILFDIPIIATNFTGAKEQLKNYKNAKIVNINPDSIAEALITYIKADEDNNFYCE